MPLYSCPLATGFLRVCHPGLDWQADLHFLGVNLLFYLSTIFRATLTLNSGDWTHQALEAACKLVLRFPEHSPALGRTPAPRALPEEDSW
jgi:hypothetical protein